MLVRCLIKENNESLSILFHYKCNCSLKMLKIHIFREVNAREEIWQGCAYAKTGRCYMELPIAAGIMSCYRESVTTSIDSYPFSPSSPWAQALPSRWVRCSAY